MSKLKSEKEQLKTIQDATEELLGQLKVEAGIKVEEKDDVSQVQIETADSGILIGYHGETLASLQLILSLMVYKKLGSWLRIIVNVGDWRQRREEALKQMAQEAADRVVATGEPVIFSDLSSFERRMIHLTLADHLQVATESEGEGRERKLIIKPRQPV